MSNPLLNESKLPGFSKIKPEHIEPAIKQLIDENLALIEKLLEENDEYSWDTLIAPLEEEDARLDAAWSPVGHMNAVVNSPALRDAYNACLPLLSEFGTRVGQNRKLFEAVKSIHDSDEFAQLDDAQQKIIRDSLRDFRMSGIDLPEDRQRQLGDIRKRLSELSSKFSENVLDATQAWTRLVTDEQQLSGLPDTARAAAKQAAENRGQEGWLFTLEFPSYLPVMSYCDNRELRKEMYEAYVTRASDMGPNAGKFDNSAIMDEILQLRFQNARLLGFSQYAEKSLAMKMAESVDQVIGFLEELADRSLPAAKKEFAELREFAAKEYGVEELQAWDVAYYAEKLQQHLFSFSQEDLRPYFPVDKVINGMFTIASRLFDIRFQKIEGVDVWHDDVRYYEVHDRNNQKVASFYLDLFARENKRGGAWMDECRVRRRRTDGALQLPVAYLTCNFNGPVGDTPALLTHDEVLTLFHEFGHGLHHMLTRVEYSDASGINGVAWDAVELPSQFMENWCWEEEAVPLFSSHYQTGEPLPGDMLEKMLAARNFQSAMMMVRQLEFSIFDMRIHSEYDEKDGVDIQGVLDEVRAKVAVNVPPSFNRFQHGFGHIFGGGYAAGYYSYKWAEVLSADAFSRFEEEGIFNQQTGLDFKRAILEKGGSREPMELFVEFRGREPSVDALLRHSGIAA